MAGRSSTYGSAELRAGQATSGSGQEVRSRGRPPVSSRRPGRFCSRNGADALDSATNRRDTAVCDVAEFAYRRSVARCQGAMSPPAASGPPSPCCDTRARCRNGLPVRLQRTCRDAKAMERPDHAERPAAAPVVGSRAGGWTSSAQLDCSPCRTTRYSVRIPCDRGDRRSGCPCARRARQEEGAQGCHQAEADDDGGTAPSCC